MFKSTLVVGRLVVQAVEMLEPGCDVDEGKTRRYTVRLSGHMIYAHVITIPPVTAEGRGAHHMLLRTTSYIFPSQNDTGTLIRSLICLLIFDILALMGVCFLSSYRKLALARMCLDQVIRFVREDMYIEKVERSLFNKESRLCPLHQGRNPRCME